MKNAHLRFGKMTFTKLVGKSPTSFSLIMDRFIGERDGKAFKAHILSVFGGDAQIAAASAIVSESEYFSVEGPGLPSTHTTMGQDAEFYRASIQISTSKRPLRHLVAVSKQFVNATQTDGRTVLPENDSDYVWASIAQSFGLPGIPQWSQWFYKKLHDYLAITPLMGLGCRPVLVSGTKEEFLRWLSDGIRKDEIQFPKQNGPARWPDMKLDQLLLATASSELNAAS